MDNTKGGGMQYTSTRLLVDDFAACFRFYRDVMGFKPTFGEEGDVYAYFDTGATGIELFIRQYMDQAMGRSTVELTSAAPDRLALSFKVDNVDNTFTQLQDKGVEFATNPTDRADWGIRAAHFRDPAGNIIEIYTGLPQTTDARTEGQD